MLSGDVPAQNVPAGVVAALRAGGCVFAEDEARLLCETAGFPEELDGLVTRRVAGEPLEHLLGWASFCGTRIVVRPGVFVPRRRTEFLVECAVARASTGAVVVDVCCGSGAVGAIVDRRVDGAQVYATDIDPVAVECARVNLRADRVWCCDLCSGLPDHLLGGVDLLVANAPYVPSDAIASMPREARCSEPRSALDGGPDGLAIHRRLIADASRWLAPGGSLLIETASSQAGDVCDVMAGSGLVASTQRSVECDATVVVGDRR